MSSSISSFKTEAKVLAALALAFLAVEAGMRVVRSRLSIDVAHIESAPKLAEGMAAQPRPRLLAIGNSLLRESVLEEPLREGMRERGLTPSLTRYYPDGTSVQEWAYAFRRYFDAAEAKPDVVLVFTGRTHLRDLAPRPTPLGAFYCATGDIPHFMARKGSTIESDAEFLLARASVAFAERARIQPRVFTAIIPHYQTMLRDMNARRNATRADRKVEWSYHDLAFLLDSIREAGARPFIVTVPAPEPYTLAPAIIETAAAGGTPILDLSGLEGLTRGNFPDGWHLDSAGAAVFTRRLADALAGLPELRISAPPAR